MSFSGSIIECALISLTLFGIGGTVKYETLKPLDTKINKSINDPKSKGKKAIFNIKKNRTKRSAKTEFDLEQQIKKTVVLWEKITRDPLKIKYGEKSNKKVATISYALKPSGEDWTIKTKTTKVKIEDKEQIVKIWKGIKGNECRFSWELKNYEKNSGKGKGLKEFFECEKCEKKGITITDATKKE